ncbi:hypothetical protein IW261DRAFT_1575309 [Armillaria novae-zelandiae]|uniref:Uncharacterized protein n=1 Tax=Armillaria novae-zelandiae TaxID=153914 RepID=A0AA39TUV7_9AGAR|nr:hypothetical protein IW261DRAFT_1575309 [Armillaria novae-zelandiae]
MTLFQQLSAHVAGIRTHESEEDLDMDAIDFEEEEVEDPKIEQHAGEERPRQTTIVADVPPSYSLREYTNYAYTKELRTLLLPPMKNVIRRLVIECATDGCDVVRKTRGMSLDDVVQELKDEAAWLDGFDELERRRID